MTRRAKRRVRQLLEQKQGGPALAQILNLPHRESLPALLGALASSRPLSKWRAVAALGRVVGRLAASDLEAGREVLRRLVWSLNDESGGIGWGAAEAMAEIMAQCRPLAQEFGQILASYLRPGRCRIDYRPLLPGALWGLGRLARAQPDLAACQQMAPHLAAYLDDHEPQVRAMAAWALGALGRRQDAAALGRLQSDPSPVLMFDGQELTQATVGRLAGQARKMLDSRQQPA